MWTLICMVLMVHVFVKMLGLAVRMSWGIFKIMMNLIFFPIVLIGLIFSGMFILALPLLIVAGIVTMVISK